MRPPPVIVPYNPITPWEYAKKLGISRKRFLEIKAITDKVLAENAHRYPPNDPEPEAAPVEAPASPATRKSRHKSSARPAVERGSSTRAQKPKTSKPR